jgi:hypothetical protein
MVRLFILLFTISSATSAVAQEFGSAKSSSEQIDNAGFTLRIVSVEQKKVSATLNFEVTFEITNATEEEVYVPNPRVEKGISFVQPEFFSAMISGADCKVAGLVDMTNKKKGTNDFTRIGPSETVQFTINPRDLNFNPTCEFHSGEKQTIRISYSAQESFLNYGFLNEAYANNPEKVVMMDIYEKVLKGTLLSEAVEFEVE